MIDYLAPVALLMGVGVMWQWLRPGGVDALTLRRALNPLMLYFAAPALVFQVVLHAPLDSRLLWVVACGWISILLSALLAGCMAMLLSRFTALPESTRGALVLAATFGNGLGVALPVTHHIFGGERDLVPLAFDLLATVPLAWTLGVFIAVRFSGRTAVNPLLEIVRLPPIWAVAAALTMNIAGVRFGAPIEAALKAAAQPAVPIMSVAVGLALSFKSGLRWPFMLAPLAIKLAVGLAIGLAIGGLAGFVPGDRVALALAAGAPSFIMGVVICDRFGLDTTAFALTMTASVLIYLWALPPLAAALVG